MEQTCWNEMNNKTDLCIKTDFASLFLNFGANKIQLTKRNEFHSYD